MRKKGGPLHWRMFKKGRELVYAFPNFHTQSFQLHGNLSPFHTGVVSN